MTTKARELTPDELTFICDPSQFAFETTQDLPDLDKIIGQERAVRAIDFGVQIPSYGFNIYAMGSAGTGKTTTVQTFLERRVHQEPAPDDWCYVNNFVDSQKPRAICLPAGHAKKLREDMADFIRELRRSIPTVFESDDYQHRAQAIIRQLEEGRDATLRELGVEANRRGFALLQTAMGLTLAPVVDGRVLSPEQYAQLPDEAQHQFAGRRRDLESELEEAMRQLRSLDKQAKEHLRALDREVASFLVGDSIDDLLQKYAAFDEVIVYLAEVRTDIVEKTSDFKQEAEAEEQTALDASRPRPPVELVDPFVRYLVNVVVDNSQSQGAPIVYATNPTYSKLIGRVEQVVRFGMLTTDFTYIRGGYLHQANGGYLVVAAPDLLASPFAWDVLKRAIKNREIRTEAMDDAMPSNATVALEPEPIPFKAKIILIGDAGTYYTLYHMDEDFRKLFKVRADFGYTMDHSSEAVHSYAEFVASRVHADGLLPFDRTAVAGIVEFGARMAEDKEELATHFVDVVEVIQEAAHWASRNGQGRVTAADVDRALEERRYRASHMEERLRKRILEGTIHIQTEGQVVGQVNGLSVMNVADYEFAVPSRISAQTYMGRGGVAAIDRDAHLTGNIYNKAVLILQAYLGGRYARKQVLSLAASVTFEQSYDRIEGDSASSAELYALLSSLSELPLRQELAVTGSVDQQGNVQAIGAVTTKVEGFFDLCQARGLTGTQGVLIPADNVRNLILRPNLVRAVQEGKFHIYAVETIDQGIELLTGVPAGEADAQGNYPEGTVNYLVQKKLAAMADERTDEDEEEEEEMMHEEQVREEEDQDDPPADSDSEARRLVN